MAGDGLDIFDGNNFLLPHVTVSNRQVAFETSHLVSFILHESLH